LLGGHFEKTALTEGRTFLWKQVLIYSLSTNICYEKLKDISDLKIFLNACAGHNWPAGRYLPAPALDQCFTTGVTRHTSVPRDDGGVFVMSELKFSQTMNHEVYFLHSGRGVPQNSGKLLSVP